ncbi:MAG: hypothetical protein DI534_06835 [Leifsonia xyli]|nr:MAG: hypothetical protein DI534_06835 [Leifsonia xyli]
MAHEAVASAWPRLLDWLNTDAEDAGLLRRVEEGAAAWDAAGRVGDDLPRGGRLAALLEWRDESAPDLTAVEGDYLRAAETAQRSEIAELAARAVRQRRQNRLLRGALVAAAALLITALAAGGLAMVRERDASAAEQDARIEAVAASARDLIDSDRDTAAILAAELYRRHPDDVRARSTLFAVLSAPIIPTAKTFFGDDQRVFGVPLPGGREVLVSSDDVAESDDGLGMRLSVWDLDDGTRVREFPARLPDASTQLPGAIHLTPDGTRAIVAYPGWKGGAPGACCSTTFVTVDLSSGEIVTGPTTIEAPIASEGSFTADGSTLVLRADDKPAPFFLDVDTLTGQQLEGADPGDGRTGYRGVTVLTDGRVAAGAVDGLDLYDAASREPVGRIPLPGDYATRSMRDLGDGTLLSAGEDGVARVEFASGRVLWTAAPGVRGCFSITPLPGGTFFCDDGVPWEASISDGQPTAREIQTQATWVFNVAAFDDGSLLVTNQRSTPFVERVPLDGSGPISRLVARGQVATDSGFADDRTIVTVPAGTVANEGLAPYRLWDLESDTGTGPISDYIDVLGHGVIGRWDEAAQSQVLSDVDGGRPRELSGGLLDGVPGVVPHGGATPDRAFAVTDTWVQPFDPTSGKALGPPLRFDGEYLAGSATVHDWAGSNRALVTWWDRDEAQMISAVFDLTTGKEIARGLYGDVAAIAIPDGRVFSTGSSELRQSDGMLQPQGTLPKPVAGANMFELSDDGRTLLLTGIDEYAALYDVPSGQKLGSDLAIDSPQWVSAHLSPDGEQLITNAPGGVLLWNLRTAGMAEAACRMAGRSLSPTEWATYFGDEARVDTCAGS